MKRLKNNCYIQLFWEFLKIGLFTIGGGMAMVPLIQDLITEKKKWMSQEEALDCIAVSQSLPGVIAINMATYVGHRQKGWKGAVIATFGVVLPSFIIIIFLAKLLQTMTSFPRIEGALQGMKFAAVALIAHTAWQTGKQILKEPLQWTLAVAAFVLIIVFNLSVAWVILGAIAFGIIGEKRGGDTL